MNSYVSYKILDDKGISLTKPQFAVRSCEVALIGPNVCDVLQNMFSQVGLGKAPEMSGLVDTCPLLIHFIISSLVYPFAQGWHLHLLHLYPFLYLIIYRVLYNPGAPGFLKHQQFHHIFSLREPAPTGPR